MPNWCENVLFVAGEPEAVKEFDRRFRGLPAEYNLDDDPEILKEQEEERREEGYEPDYCLHALVPVPEYILEKGYGDAGYDWQINNWGTKWDIYHQKVSVFWHEEEIVEYRFMTAWGPPADWLRKVARMFPDLEFRNSFFEPGTMIRGERDVLVYNTREVN